MNIDPQIRFDYAQVGGVRLHHAIAGALQVIAHDVLDQRRMAWENDAPNPTEESD